jgi:hypothetical protein
LATLIHLPVNPLVNQPRVLFVGWCHFPEKVFNAREDGAD